MFTVDDLLSSLSEEDIKLLKASLQSKPVSTPRAKPTKPDYYVLNSIHCKFCGHTEVKLYHMKFDVDKQLHRAIPIDDPNVTAELLDKAQHRLDSISKCPLCYHRLGSLSKEELIQIVYNHIEVIQVSKKVRQTEGFNEGIKIINKVNSSTYDEQEEYY